MADAPSRTIPEMYAEWLATRNRPSTDKTDEEMDKGSTEYQRLQAQIIATEPATPADVAMMYLVDTDYGDSYPSDTFEARVRELAGQGVNAAPPPSPLDVLLQQKHEAENLHDRQIKETDAHIEAGTATDDVWQAQFDACNVVDAIVLEICAYRPANAAEQDRKARFLLEWTKDTEASEDEVKALLTSMLLTVDGRASA
ncbi:hypothetical protein WMC41_16120 [Shinella yambaruensis]|uniref:hypothetical protein n=1 Tax=Shinella yambaruensis TaxID=415996 RepID=UPI003D7B9DCA